MKFNRLQVVLSIFFFLLLTSEAFPQNSSQDMSTNTSKMYSNVPVTSSKCNQFTFDATGSYDPDNDNISFLWEFGDGTASYEPIVTHSFEYSGEYEVKLTISDSLGMQNSAAVIYQSVKANIPPFAIINAPEKVCVDQIVNFDGSKSYDDTNEQLSFSWNFGDGTSNTGNAAVAKTYKKAGLYTANLTVTDNSQSTCSAHTSEKFIFVNAPPNADAGRDEILKCIARNNNFVVTFDGTNSSDPNGDPLIYLWDFGDGFSYEGVSTVHRYQEVGTYDAKLIVSDSSNQDCSKDIDFVKVRLNVAPEANAGPDILACPGKIINFDGSNSYVYQKGTDISKWFFGDGVTKNGLVTQHMYEKSGQYQASLTMENELNSMCPSSRDTKLVTINSPPTVELKSLDSICLGETIQFDASSAEDKDGDNLEYYWSFGDGSVLKAGPVVNHQFKHGGEYRVAVIVDDKKATSCSTATAEKVVKINTPPIADAGPNLSCCVNVETVFSATGSSDPDGNKLSYSWDLGDGTKAEGAIIEHAYKRSGSYNVGLLVDDNSGTSCSKSTTNYVAQINATPIPKINVR